MKEDNKSRQNDKLNMQQELDRPGKLMVSGIPKVKDYKETDLEKLFAAFGRVTEVYIVRDKRTTIPRGFAFVTYENPQDSEIAIKSMEGKDLGGECKVHCEQARIGLKKSMAQNPPGQGGARGSGGGGRGGGRGRGSESYNGRGTSRGGGIMDRGRGMNRGRGLLDRARGMMDRGRGIMGRGLMNRGRGLINMGARGMPPLGMGLFDEESYDYQEEEFYEEFYDAEPPNMRFPQPGGPGGLSLRGHMPGRGGAQSFASLASRKALLPDPLGRGGRISAYQGSLLGPAPDDFYGDDANEADYYGDNGDPYAESRGEAYPEDVDYPSEEYYEQEWQAPPRGRGAAASRGRGLIPRPVPEARASRQQMDDYGYEAEGAPPQRSRAIAPVSRRGAQAYAEELFDEEDIRLSGVASDPYSMGRGRPPTSAGPSASSARLGRVNPAGRAGAAPARRVGPLLEADPYADEDPSMYERVTAAALKGGAARAQADYEDDPYADPYGRRVAPGGSRPTAAGRSRAAMMSDAMYPGERSQPKPLMEADAMTRKGPGASRVDDDDEYQGQGLLGAQPRAAYSEGRRPMGRRGNPNFGTIEEMYGRMAAETDPYASFQPSSRGAGDMFSDPYSRKRPIDPYEDAEMGGHAMSAMRRDYEAAVIASKRDRVDRGGDRGGYDPYSRQEAMFRGL